MNKYEIVKFEQGDLALDVSVSPAEETEEINRLFQDTLKTYLKKVN